MDRLLIVLVVLVSIYNIHSMFVKDKKQTHKKNLDQVELGRRHIVQPWEKEF